jgi:hypothetical protein
MTLLGTVEVVVGWSCLILATILSNPGLAAIGVVCLYAAMNGID